MTSEEHNKFLGIAFLVHGGIQVAMTLLMLLFFGVFFLSLPGRPGEPEFPPAFFAIFFTFALVFQLFFALPSLIASYALFQKEILGKNFRYRRRSFGRDERADRDSGRGLRFLVFFWRRMETGLWHSAAAIQLWLASGPNRLPKRRRFPDIAERIR